MGGPAGGDKSGRAGNGGQICLNNRAGRFVKHTP